MPSANVHPLHPRGPVDVFERLHERRIVFLRGPIQETVADELIARLMDLDAADDAPVQLLIDSPGGDTFGMMAIYDAIQLMRSRVDTRCLGLAASAGAFLLATGTGTRSAGANARVMIHQPHGGVGGQRPAADVLIAAEMYADMRARMEAIVAEVSGKTVEQVHADMDRDRWMSANEAKDYGLIDEVLSRSS